MNTIGVFSRAFWILAIGVVALFAFFVLMGGFSPGDVIVLSAAVAGLIVAFVIHAIRVNHDLHEHGHEALMHELHRMRERRGF